jgi:hypothetical protein
MRKIFVSVLLVLVCLNSISAENSNDLLKYLNFEKADQQFVCATPDGKYPHRECHKYWMCSNGLPYEFNCPPGLYYNKNKQECDWPQNVECNPNPTTIEEETPSEIDSTTSVSGFICPEEFGVFPHEDCTKFWECIKFLGHEMSCPEGEAWNDLAKKCDEKSFDTCFNSGMFLFNFIPLIFFKTRLKKHLLFCEISNSAVNASE